MKIRWIDQADSTNSSVTDYVDDLEEGVILAARCQLKGRGQKGNSWESEPYKNLSFSAMWHPEAIVPRDQFCISEATALAVVELLKRNGIEAKVKWPNDIYVGDKKICGILIEHSVMGMDLSRSIAGVGINVNQKEFLSDAPNPVSMTQLTGDEYSLEALLDQFREIFERQLEVIQTPEGRKSFHSRFKEGLWRGDGRPYPFKDMDTGEIYDGIITGVAESGMLTILNVAKDRKREYAFKEVEFLLR